MQWFPVIPVPKPQASRLRHQQGLWEAAPHLPWGSHPGRTLARPPAASSPWTALAPSLATCSLSHFASASSSPSLDTSRSWRGLKPVGPAVIHPYCALPCCLPHVVSAVQRRACRVGGVEVYNTFVWWYPNVENILPSPSTLGVSSSSCFVSLFCTRSVPCLL